MQTGLKHLPIALRKFSISASVFFTSAEYISLPTMGQKGTFVPSSWLTASASAVLPVPGPPASRTALPDIFFCFTRSTTKPHACKTVNTTPSRASYRAKYLSSCGLPDEPSTRRICMTIRPFQTQSLDMRVRSCPVLARIALHLADGYRCRHGGCRKLSIPGRIYCRRARNSECAWTGRIGRR